MASTKEDENNGSSPATSRECSLLTDITSASNRLMTIDVHPIYPVNNNTVVSQRPLLQYCVVNLCFVSPCGVRRRMRLPISFEFELVSTKHNQRALHCCQPFLLTLAVLLPRLVSVQITGLITSSISWDTVLEKIFSDKVNGVDCVLETETQAYTYGMRNGKAFFK